MIVVHGLLAVIAAALFFAAARYTWFAVLAWYSPPAPPPAREPRTRFCVLIPAHNEAATIRDTVEVALRLDYPPELYRVLVLADNCDDGTVGLARAAGAQVVERFDPAHAGKGQAIAWVLALHGRPGEALVIVDADSRPAHDYLRWMDRALQSGYGAAQGFNGSANPDESSLAALAAITSGMKNGLHYAGKTAAGKPVPLMNGLTIAADTLREHPWQSFSLVEDFETYLRLVNAGVPIRFVPEAKILSPRAGRFAAAAVQKQRWSGGQSRLARRVAWPMAVRALRERQSDKLSAALDLLLPGYATVTGLLFAVALLGYWLSDGEPRLAVGLSVGGLLLMMIQFALGLARMRWTPRLAWAVALAPVYIVWKMLLAARSFVRLPGRWNRAVR
jgi:cellulose synthase/poly-beta-1,6-N-acetylglucosamine synthase-like glycosyltransferase